MGLSVHPMSDRRPYSFRGTLPASARLTRASLRLPLAWRLVGRQFLVVAEKP
jgi:hypothetical protein